MKQLKVGIIFLVLGLLGCAEDVDRFTPDPPDDVELVGDIGRFFDQIDKSQFTTTQSVYSDFPINVVTPRNTIVSAPGSAFEDFDGNIATGFIDLQIMELRTPGEILMAGIPTETYGTLLQSGGEFFITASQNGEKLRLRDGMQIQLRVEDNDPKDEMELWYGVTEDVPGQGQVQTWDDADNDPVRWDNVTVSEWTLQDSSQGGVITGFGYECFSDSLNWINIDLFYDLPEEERTDVCVDLPEIFGNVNTVVYLIFEDFNGIIALPGDPEGMQFCNFYSKYIQTGVPLGAPVTFVVISEQGEDCYYYAQVSTNLVLDHLEVIEPEKTALEDIKDALMML